MSERRVQRTIAVLDGVGTVMSGGGPLTEVRYHLDVTQEFVIVSGRTGIREMPGVQEITGTLGPPPNASLPMAGAQLTLVMEDGREIDFTMTGMMAGEYQIMGSGELHDPRHKL